MHQGKFNEGPCHSRIHKTCCCTLCCFPSNALLTPLRKLVSKKKRRYAKDGFNLDLTYITPRIICHGFPAVGVEHLYRNPRSEVRRFLEEKHGGRYKVFNFCCEPGRGYSPSEFDGRVERYPFRDHGVPPLDTISQFCNSAKQWLDADPKNVVSLHCKAGKGRAGIMTCCLLVRTGFRQSALEAMEYYDRTRVTNGKGLTVTSQRKFVLLYERLWRDVWELPKAMDIGKSPTEDAPGDRYPLPSKPSMDATSLMIIDLPKCFRKSKSTQFQFKVVNGTTSEKFDFEEAGKSDVGGADTVFFVKASIKDNFAIQLWGIDKKKMTSLGGLLSLGKGKKKFKIAEMWCNVNWLKLADDQTFFDFPVAELNVKKKWRKKIGGERMTLRLGFGEDYERNHNRTRSCFEGSHATIGSVSVSEYGGEDIGDVEMQLVAKLDTEFSVNL
ncbi:hypothetical protein ScalyP_jg7314 [Parmales sp. scaly parma]|nr:hypothetical protein ScalyP_jg7314 [Parmales sp. scaly parma]